MLAFQVPTVTPTPAAPSPPEADVVSGPEVVAAAVASVATPSTLPSGSPSNDKVINEVSADTDIDTTNKIAVGGNSLNEETNEVIEKISAVVVAADVDGSHVDVESENDGALEDGEIANDKEDIEEGDQNEENETPKRIVKYDRESLLRIAKATGNKGKVEIQTPDIVKDGKNNHMDKNGGYNQNRTPVNHQTNSNYHCPLVISPTPSRVPRALEIQTKVESPKSENLWKPTRTQNRGNSNNDGMSVDEKQTQAIVKQARGILNKLTPENFDKLLHKFLKLELNDREDRISAVILVVFEKAINEPSFFTAYARMVQHVCLNSQETAKKFRKSILDQCQKDFQKTIEDEDEVKAAEMEIENAPVDKKETLKLELEEKKFQMRRRSLGNIRFIGELYKFNMLTPKIMVDCVHFLLGTQDEISLECLCKLLTTVGQKLDNQLKEIETRAKLATTDNNIPTPKFIPDPHCMDNIFNKLRKLSNEASKLSSRIRFALLDAVELRENDWKPRRDSNAPKMIEEVRREAARQELREKRQINALLDVNMGQRRPSPLNQSGSIQQKMGSVWNPVQSIKTSRFSQVKKPSELSQSPVPVPPVILGWNGQSSSRGSSSSRKNPLPPRFQQLQNQQGQGSSRGSSSSSKNQLPPRFQQLQNQQGQGGARV